jgi:hypothetical protein
MKDKITLVGKVPRKKRRATELYAHDTPFKPKVEKNKKKEYTRHSKYRKNDDTDF